MPNIQNVRIGPCSITWKTQDLGHTQGGVKLTYERKMTDLTVDKYGDSPVDKALTGVNLKAVFKMAEPVVALLQRVNPEGLNTSGVNGQQLGLGADAGYSARGDAGLLVLHPLNKTAGDLSEDINIYLAVPTQNTELNYEVDNQRLVEIEMTALITEIYQNGRRLGHIGPSAVS